MEKTGKQQSETLSMKKFSFITTKEKNESDILSLHDKSSAQCLSIALAFSRLLTGSISSDGSWICKPLNTGVEYSFSKSSNRKSVNKIWPSSVPNAAMPNIHLKWLLKSTRKKRKTSHNTKQTQASNYSVRLKSMMLDMQKVIKKNPIQIWRKRRQNQST